MIYILPGMGANAKMYTSNSIWQTIPNAMFLDWPQWNGELSLSDIADSIIELYLIKKGQILIGSSLGGMAALEIARKTDAKQTILLGSAQQRNEINSFLVGLAPLAKITPLRFIQALTGKSNSDFLNMFRSVDPEFIRHMCLAINNWEGLNLNTCIRIHGSKDFVIPCPNKAKVVEGAGHLLAISHAEECVELIKEIIKSL